MTVTSQDGERQPASTKSLFRLTIFLIVLDVFFLSFSVLDAIALAPLYTSLARFSIIGLVFLAGMLLLISMSEESLPIFLLSLLSLGVGIGAMLLGPLIVFATICLLIPVFFALFAYGGRVLLTYPNSRGQVQILLSIVIPFSINWIIMESYVVDKYSVRESMYLGDKSYHLTMYTTDTIDTSISHIMLFECSRFGTACHSIYQSNLDYFSDDRITWEITEGEETILTIIAYDEVIHREVISSE